MDLDTRFSREIVRYGITILEDQNIISDTFTYRQPWGGFRIKVRRGLHGAAKLEAVALQLGRISLGHDFQRSAWTDERRNRREWREAIIWAALRLVPGSLLSRARREEWPSWGLADAAGVTEYLAWVRWELASETPGRIVSFPARPSMEASEEFIGR